MAERYDWSNLAEDYVRLGSQRAVAEEYGTSKLIVARAMRRYGVQPNPHGGVNRIDKSNLLGDIDRLGTPSAIADEYGCSVAYVNTLLRKTGTSRTVKYGNQCVMCGEKFLAKGCRKRTCNQCTEICSIIRCDKAVLCNGACSAHDRQMRIYNLSSIDLSSLIELGCAICHDLDNLHIDHDHACCQTTPTCGKCNRGALCARHNYVCGKLHDDPTEADATATYLRTNNVVDRPLPK